MPEHDPKRWRPVLPRDHAQTSVPRARQQCKHGHNNDVMPVSIKSGPSGWLRALQLLVAFAVIAAALHDPFHAAIAVGFLVGLVLVNAGMHAGLAGGFTGVFRIHGG